MCWELTGARELRNSDFLQIFPVLLTPVSVSVTAQELLRAGPAQYVRWRGERICLWIDSHVDRTEGDTIKKSI